VDLLHTSPRVNATELLQAEKSLSSRVDCAIASSVGVLNHLQLVGFKNVQLWENVGSLPLPERTPTKLTRAIFAGHLTDAKVDFDLVLSLLDLDVEIAFAGPRPLDGTALGPSAKRVLAHPRFKVLGVLQEKELGFEIASSTFAIIPYKIDQHTRGIFPLKIFEYLSTGTPVVSTGLYSLVESKTRMDGLRVARSQSEFLELCRIASKGVDHYESDLIQLNASLHSWESRGKQSRDLIRRLLEEKFK